MRIIDEFDAGLIKMTVFQMNGRISIKAEAGLMEQVFKFRDGSGIENAADARRFCDDQFLEKVSAIFSQMAAVRNQRFDRMIHEESGSDLII
jgi:hypothetical protein